MEINGGPLSDGTGTYTFYLRDVSLVETPGYVNLTSFDGTGIDTSRVTDAHEMFAGDVKLKTLTNMVGWDMTHVMDFGGMFKDCRALASLSQIRTWKPVASPTLAGMFEGCTSLPDNADIAGWDTSKVRDFSRMFYGDTALTKLDLSDWDMHAATNLADMIGVDGSSDEHLSLTTIVASPAGALLGTGLNDDLLDRKPTDGMWRLTNPTSGTWFDRSTRLAERYPLDANSQFRGDLTYTWDPDVRGGRFTADGDAWWTYDERTSQLKLGSDRKDVQVEMAAANLPWVGYVGLDKIDSVASQGGIILHNPARWFAGYENLTSFDGSGMDVKESTDLSGLFANDGKLATLTGVDLWETGKAQEMNDIFSGCVGLGDDDLEQLLGWDTGSATTLANLFKGCTGITTLDSLRKWNVGNCRDFSSMFEGCTGITDQTPIAGWKVQGASDLSRMFAGCTKLQKVDFSQWDMTACTVKDMLAGDAALTSIGTSAKTVLSGTGLSNDLAGKSPNEGSWKRVTAGTGNPAWADSTSKLADLYAQGGYPGIETCTYEWEGILRGRFRNQHVWWEYNVDTKTLTIGFDGVAGKDSDQVDETAEELPWRALAPPAGHEGEKGYTHVMERVVFESGVNVKNPSAWFKDHDKLVDVKADDLRLDQATSLASLFEGCTSLASLSGTGAWNPASATDFNNAFKGTQLAELDLTGWTMAGKAGAKVDGMLADMAKLASLTLEPGAVLTGTGLDAIATRELHAGVWRANGSDVAATGGNEAGSTASLVALYPAEGARPVAEKTTYTWVLENRFDSNEDAWWRFDPKTGTLTIGVKTKDEGNTHGFTVSEYGTYGDHASNLPWRNSLDPTLVKHIVMQNGIAPKNLSAWFADFTNLETFDGSNVEGGADVSATTSFAELFRGSFLSAEGRGEADIHTWDLSGARSGGDVPTLTDMFAGTMLTKLVAGAKTVLDGTGFASMPERGTDSGMWRTDPETAGTATAATNFADTWFDTTAHLAGRYPAGGNALGTHVTYTWVPGKGGLFPDNDNAWWAYDAATRQMWIGAGPGTEKKVTVGTS